MLKVTASNSLACLCAASSLRPPATPLAQIVPAKSFDACGAPGQALQSEFFDGVGGRGELFLGLDCHLSIMACCPRHLRGEFTVPLAELRPHHLLLAGEGDSSLSQKENTLIHFWEKPRTSQNSQLLARPTLCLAYLLLTYLVLRTPDFSSLDNSCK